MKKGYVIYNSLGHWLNRGFVWVSAHETEWIGQQTIHPNEALYAIEKALLHEEIQPILKMKAYESESGETILTGEAYNFSEVLPSEFVE